MASAVKDCAEHGGSNEVLAVADMEYDGDEEEEEEEDDLFEINLDAVNTIPPPHYWESCYTRTGNTLLANCLLPIADVSNAVPILVPSNSNTFSSLRGMCNFLMIFNSAPGKVMGFTSLGAFGLRHARE